jgi:hypothetical protein
MAFFKFDKFSEIFICTSFWILKFRANFIPKFHSTTFF